MRAKILINSVDKIKDFVNIVVKYPCDCDLMSGKYVIDAKSLIGIFSLDVSKPIDLVVHDETADLEPVRKFFV